MLTGRRAGAARHSRTRSGLAVGAAVALALTAGLAVLAGPAAADPPANCHQTPTQPHCQVGGDVPGGPGGPGGGGNNGGGNGGGSAGPCMRDGVVLPCYDAILGWFNRQDGCYYREMEPQPDGVPDGQTAYLRSCSGLQEPVNLDDPPGGYAAPPDPEVIALRLLAGLDLRSPGIGVAPSDGPGLVGLPIWLWDAPAAGGGWRAVRASDTEQGLTVSIEARITKIVWRMGNGDTVTCTSPGVEYDAAVHAGDEPACGYPGYDKPRNYTIQATATWRVTYESLAGSGTLSAVPNTTSTRNIEIDELQVVTE